ncbi:hypothetical protein AV953_gp33 [Thermus virus IN93]|uniref:Helix-turn-helix domain-containing protein n=1 Tax=Thermus virus IN93 TaxID=1714273 RepID=B3XVT0_9VIRU|nr:hypothetical protein AV953_gp33 [Thermus virus IN93]BAG55212.1 unnamed protein product [Thermus virus IN93]
MTRLLTTKEVAQFLRKSPLWVRRQIRAGALRAVRVGRDYRVREEDLALFLGFNSDISVPIDQSGEAK